VPRADQSPVLDRSARQVCAQMSTLPRVNGQLEVPAGGRIKVPTSCGSS
jgi:hypothetical protein